MNLSHFFLTWQAGAARRLLRLLTVAGGLVFISGLAGCGGGAPLETFDLEIKEIKEEPILKRPSPVVVMISEPLTSSALNTDRIVARTEFDSLSYLPGIQWSDRIPRLIQGKVIQAFEKANGPGKVVRPEESIPSDYKLFFTLRRFDVDLAARSACVELSVKLTLYQTGQIRSAESFAECEVSPTLEGIALTQSFGRALNHVVERLIPWVDQATTTIHPSRMKGPSFSK